jgi:hypothetical protein
MTAMREAPRLAETWIAGTRPKLSGLDFGDLGQLVD